MRIMDHVYITIVVRIILCSRIPEKHYHQDKFTNSYLSELAHHNIQIFSEYWCNLHPSQWHSWVAIAAVKFSGMKHLTDKHNSVMLWPSSSGELIVHWSDSWTKILEPLMMRRSQRNGDSSLVGVPLLENWAALENPSKDHHHWAGSYEQFWLHVSGDCQSSIQAFYWTCPLAVSWIHDHLGAKKRVPPGNCWFTEMVHCLTLLDTSDMGQKTTLHKLEVIEALIWEQSQLRLSACRQGIGVGAILSW